MGARARAALGRVPKLMRFGLALVVLGGAVDIGYHVGAGPRASMHHPIAFIGHVVILTGMVVTMIGLFETAIKGAKRASHGPMEGVSR